MGTSNLSDNESVVAASDAATQLSQYTVPSQQQTYNKQKDFRSTCPLQGKDAYNGCMPLCQTLCKMAGGIGDARRADLIESLNEGRKSIFGMSDMGTASGMISLPKASSNKRKAKRIEKIHQSNQT